MNWRLIPCLWALVLAAFPVVVLRDFATFCVSAAAALVALAGNGSKSFRHYCTAGILLLAVYTVLITSLSGFAAGIAGVFTGVALFLFFETAYLVCVVPQEGAAGSGPENGRISTDGSAAEIRGLIRSLLRRSAQSAAAALLLLVGFWGLSHLGFPPAEYRLVLLLAGALGLGAFAAWLLTRR